MAAALLLIVALLGAANAASAPAVILVVIDGLDAEFVGDRTTPTLAKLAARGERGVFFPHARAVMPSVTNTNHVSLLSGAYPAAHGIVGNRDWSRDERTRSRALDAPRWIETDTVFNAHRAGSDGVSAAGIFGKWKLAELFRYAPGPLPWADLEGEAFLPDPHGSFGSDERTMNQVIRTLAEQDPRFLFVNLGDVDRTAHVYGPESPQARKAVLEADRQLGRLVRALEDTERWDHTVLVVTADHGFSGVAPDADRPFPTISFGRELRREGIDGAVVVANGRVAFVYLAGIEPTKALEPAAQQRLGRIREIALRQPEIADALYRRPNPADGGEEHTLASRHPDWRIDHPRAGELVVVAAPGCHLSDPWSPGIASMRGTHGGPEDRSISVLWTGGWEGLPALRISESTPTNADVGSTVRHLLGLGPPRRLADGRLVAEELLGTVLPEVVESARTEESSPLGHRRATSRD